jgi:hypothetical protein
VTEGKSRSPWVYVGVGCTVVAVVLLAAVVGLGFWVYRAAKKIQVDMKDPIAREAKVKTLLGARDLPAGYRASLSVSIPFLMDMAILGDREPEFGKDAKLFDKRGFIFVKTIKPRDDAKLDAWLEGKGEDKEMVPGSGVDVVEGQEIGRGTIEREDMKVHYVAQRGALNVHGQSVDGISSFLVIECPGDNKFRLGIWFGPDLDPPESAGSAGFSGTPADESAIREFLSHFAPCAS